MGAIANFKYEELLSIEQQKNMVNICATQIIADAPKPGHLIGGATHGTLVELPVQPKVVPMGGDVEPSRSESAESGIGLVYAGSANQRITPEIAANAGGGTVFV